jgi:hypothetical protein
MSSAPRVRKGRRLATWPVFAAALWFSLGSPPVQATTQLTSGPDAQAVVVLPPHCDTNAFPLDAFLDVLRVELAGRGLLCCALGDPNAWPPPTASIRVELHMDSCVTAANQVRAFVFDAAHSRGLGHEISLADVAETTRPRALALIVAELIRSLGQDPAVQAKATPPEATKPLPPRPHVVSPHALASAMDADFEVRSYPSRDTTMWGGRLRFTAGWRSLHADLDAGGGLAHRQVELGQVQARAATVGLTVGPRFKAGVLLIDLGVRGELGWAWVDGVAGSTGVHAGGGSDWISSAGLRLSLEAPNNRLAGVRIGAEGGSAIHRFSGEANGQAVVGISGFYWLASVGITLSRP